MTKTAKRNTVITILDLALAVATIVGIAGVIEHGTHSMYVIPALMAIPFVLVTIIFAVHLLVED